MFTTILVCVLLVCLAYVALTSRLMSLNLDDLEHSMDAFVVTVVKQHFTTSEYVDSATTQIEDVHKALTDASFELLEANPKTREAGKKIREAHDLAADNIYTTIRTLNKGVKILKTEIDSRAKRRSEAYTPKKLDNDKE